MYPKSIYKNHLQAVVFCAEEHAARTADGWSDFKPAEAPIATATDTASTPSTTDGEAPPVPPVQKLRLARRT